MENTLIKFCQAWTKQDFDTMYIFCTKTWKGNHSRSELKKLIIGGIKEFKIGAINAIACVCDIKLSVTHKNKIRSLDVRLIKEKGIRKPSVDGEWGVNPISLIKNLYG